ncbi:MAG TPA: dockerin type I domain-containing protein [Lacipirellula sp.]
MSRLWNRGLRRCAGRQGLNFEGLEQRLLLSGAPPAVTGVYVGSTEWSSAFYDYLAPQATTELGFQIPAGSTSQVKSLPWVNIDKIVIQFSEDVNIKVGDLSLSGISATAFPFEHFFYDAFTRVATWTLASPLTKNSYQIDLNGDGLDPVSDLQESVLDGEWTNNSDTFPSGNGVAGGDFQFNFKVMPGDVNQNAAVETMDVSAVNSRVGATTLSANYSPLADIDGDGVITSGDVQDVQSRLWSTYPSQGPVGLYNDAPSTTGGRAIAITDLLGNVGINLYDDFSDAETPDNQLTYEIVSNSDPSLFDDASIDPATGILNLNSAAGQSGRSTITVKATDSSGLWTTATYVVDVNYTNSRPWLDFEVRQVEGSTFEIVGYVLDDGVSPEGMIVNFSGAYVGRASVYPDGSFAFAVIIPPENWGNIYATVTDFQGSTSDLVIRTAAVT